ncbi:MAG: alpha/beta fold hydrolase [Candidatus Saganbacteria bacterium]|nr:alpha/beta fold hydrolase [Candidatus Saganbacteria bacterium]
MPEIKTVPNSDILYRHWSANNPKAIFLGVHGLGAHSDRWNFFGNFFIQKEISSYAIELKGFGVTKDRPRGHIDSFKTYYRDLLLLLYFIKKANPNKKVFLIGESLGGLITFLFALKHQKLVSGLILMSPAFKNGMTFSLLTQLDAFSALLYNPKKQIEMPFTSAMCTRDEQQQNFMDQDSRELRTASAKLILNTLLGQIEAGFKLKSLQLPTLTLLSGKDYLIDAKEGKKMHQKFKHQDKALIEYPEMLHALYIDSDREKVFQDILDWTERRL